MEAMNPLEIIAHKQEGRELSAEEIKAVIEGYVLDSVPDYQMAAFLMAVFFQGMSQEETIHLIKAMIASGKRAEFKNVSGRKVDKHSTGGVGDKISTLVAPIVASLGIPVPMISGRGLGHTGGTLDKLESIPGFTTSLSIRDFERQVEEIGCALIGQSEEIVPADLKMYALRNATNTVRSIPLVTASILSKKIAEGIDALLLDVKFGRGAFFQELHEARELAENLVATAEALGLKATALLTNMDQPLGRAVGNWLEIRECLEIMTGKVDAPDVLDLSLTEAALMQILAGAETDYHSARGKAARALESGAAYRKFLEIAKRQKADIRVTEDRTKSMEPPCSHTIFSPASGYLQELDALVIGRVAVKLGAGRQSIGEVVDHLAGLILHKKVGDKVNVGEPLVTLYASSDEEFEGISSTILGAYRIGPELPESKPLIHSEISTQGERPWVH